MLFHSTRGKDLDKTFEEVLLQGLASDGGLFMPNQWPQVDIKHMRNLESFIDVAKYIVPMFTKSSFSDEEVNNLLESTWHNFSEENFVKIQQLNESNCVLELFHGSTSAFKDFGLQLAAAFFDLALSKKNKTAIVFGATSGDTGPAAEYAMRGKKGVRVFMLSPHSTMSPFQAAQMYSLMDDNIFNIAIKGVFDDCQDIVKAVSNDLSFKDKYKIGAVNSINWGRILAQIVYYFKGYFDVTSNNREKVDFTVPTGNFGNICAGHIAREMGLPINHLIVATNENDVLDEFFRTGNYEPRSSEETFQTSSPSMDISKASNFERFIFDLLGRDSNLLRQYWGNIDKGGSFKLDDTSFQKIKNYGFISSSSKHINRIDFIRSVYNDFNTIIDTHTADGIKAALDHIKNIPMLVLETALPIKFEKSVFEAIGVYPERPFELKDLELMDQRFEVFNSDTEQVKNFIINNS